MPTLSQHACFSCRKVFKKPHEYSVTPTVRRCPQCGGEMVAMGYKFRAPRADDVREWSRIKTALREGRDYGIPTLRKIDEEEDANKAVDSTASRDSPWTLGDSAHMRIPLLLSLFVALTAVSCRYPNEFKNTPKNSPHALLRGTAYPNAGHAFATHINGQPTSFWRSGDVFRISPGTTAVRAAFSDRQETLGYDAQEFVAIAGGEYVIAREREPAAVSPLTAMPHPKTRNAWVIHDRRDRVTIRRGSASGPDRTVADAPKVDYMFGYSSADEAIAEYRKRNP